MDKQDIQRLIDSRLQYSTRKVGDTPTDALQLVPKKYVDARALVGTVINGVKGPIFPVGWTVTHIGTAQYSIVHNLGISNISVVAMQRWDHVQRIHVGTVNDIDENSFQLWWWDISGGGNQDVDFDFIFSTN